MRLPWSACSAPSALWNLSRRSRVDSAGSADDQLIRIPVPRIP